MSTVVTNIYTSATNHSRTQATVIQKVKIVNAVIQPECRVYKNVS